MITTDRALSKTATARRYSRPRLHAAELAVGFCWHPAESVWTAERFGRGRNIVTTTTTVTVTALAANKITDTVLEVTSFVEISPRRLASTRPAPRAVIMSGGRKGGISSTPTAPLRPAVIRAVSVTTPPSFCQLQTIVISRRTDRWNVVLQARSIPGQHRIEVMTVPLSS